MKKIFCFLIVLFFCITGFAQEVSKKRVFNVVYFFDYQPFSWIDKDNNMKGILVETLEESLRKKMGFLVVHKGYPWARAQNYVKVGTADAFVTVPTPERKKYTLISKKPVLVATFTLFVNKNHKEIKSLKKVKSIKELKKFKLIHYLGSGWAKKNLKGMNVAWESSLKYTLKMLSINDKVVFVDTSQVIRYNIKKYKYTDKIIEVKNILDTTSFNLCVSKKSKHKNILNKFDKVIKQMKKDGALNKIYNKYR